jgi:hypothetical protein
MCYNDTVITHYISHNMFTKSIFTKSFHFTVIAESPMVLRGRKALQEFSAFLTLRSSTNLSWLIFGEQSALCSICMVANCQFIMSNYICIKFLLSYAVYQSIPKFPGRIFVSICFFNKSLREQSRSTEIYMS